MKASFTRPTAWNGIAGLALVAIVLHIAASQAWAQFGGSCGCPVIVSDPQMYGRQAEQLTQETRIADLAAQNTTTGGSGLWQSQMGFLNELGRTMGQSGGLCYGSPNAAQQFKADFPGAAPPPVNAAQHMQQLAAVTLGTLTASSSRGVSDIPSLSQTQTAAPPIRHCDELLHVHTYEIWREVR